MSSNVEWERDKRRTYVLTYVGDNWKKIYKVCQEHSLPPEMANLKEGTCAIPSRYLFSGGDPLRGSTITFVISGIDGRDEACDISDLSYNFRFSL